MLAILLLCAFYTKAVYFVGGSITYKPVDSSNYEVTVKLYTDCNGFPLINDSLIVSWGTTSFKQKMSLISTKDITGDFTGCPARSRCSGGTYVYGFEEREYKTTVNISGSSCEVTFGFKGGLRSGGISTGASNTQSYLYAKFNKCAGLNNSAYTILPPKILIPVGVNAYMTNAYIEPDKGDSVAFELTNPLDDNKAIVPYTGQLSASRPITFLGFPNMGLGFPAGIQFDNATGGIVFRPTAQNQETVFVFKIYEYRKINGVMTVVAERIVEQLVRVIPSPNNRVPTLAGASEIYICSGERAVIKFTSNDVDANDTTTIEWDGTIPGGTFTVDTSGRLATAEFSWTPTLNDVKISPYVFTATVKDNACSPRGEARYLYKVYVVAKTTKGYSQIALKQNSCGQLKLFMGVAAPTNVIRGFIAPDGFIKSATKDQAEIYFATAGWHKFAVWAKEGIYCPDTAWDSTFVTLPYVLQTNHTPNSAICPDSSITLTASPINGSMPYIHQWEYDTVIISPTYKYTARSSQAVHIYFRVIDSLGCYLHDSIKISTHTLQQPKFTTPNEVCRNAPPIVLTAIPKGGFWQAPSVVNDSIFRPDSIPFTGGTATVVYHFTDSNGCGVQSPTAIKVIPSPILQLVATPTVGLPPLKVDFFGFSFPDADNWKWHFTNTSTNKTDSINGQIPTVTFNDTGWYSITVSADTAGCRESYTKAKYIYVGDTTQQGGGGVGIITPSSAAIKIYPNPVNDKLVIETEEEIAKITLYGIRGEMIEIDKISKSKNNFINVSGLAQGLYVFKIEFINNSFSFHKVMVYH